MLNIIRKNAQSIVVQSIVVIIAIVFIFWGAHSSMNSNSRGLAVVNGKEISYRDFQQNYERAIERYKQQFGGQMPEKFIESIGLKEQVLNQLIQSELLRQGAEKMGVSVSKEATQRKIQEMEAFSRDGRFDLAHYKMVLERNHLSTTSFETGIRNDLLMSRAGEALGAFAEVSDAEINNWLEYIDQEIKVAYAAIKSEAYASQVKVVDSELQSWFESAKQNYKTAPQSKLRYLAFPFAEDLHQVAVTDEAVQQYYQDHADVYSVPEQRRARHILFRAGEDETAESRAGKRVAAEKVLAQIKNGADFAALAKQFSEDSSKDKGGDLGFFARGQMVSPFEDAVFALQAGAVSGVIETPFGYHIVKLEEMRPAAVRSLAEVSGSIRKELESQGVKAITFKKASSAYEDIIRAGSLEKFSEKSSVPVMKTDFFAQASPPAQAPKGSMVHDPAFLQAAFGLRKGELSSIVETATGYAVIFVDDAKESVAPELAAVRERATADYTKEKSVELARAAAESLLQKAKAEQSWPAGLERKETGYMKRIGEASGAPEEMRREAFGLAGQGAFPEKPLVIGNVFYIYQVADSRRGANEMDANKRRALEQQLLAARKNTLMAEWIGLVKQEANIWTNAKMLQ
jgi:peptidyl-prolyl cis-trans isomerase D